MNQNALELITRMRDDLNDDGTGAFTNEKLLRYLNRAYYDLCGEETVLMKGWLQSFEDVDLVAGTATYNLPADAWVVKIVEFLNASGEYAPGLPVAEIDRSLYEGGGSEVLYDAAAQYRWYLSGSKIGVTPEPKEGKVAGMRVRYFPYPRLLHIGTVLDADATTCQFSEYPAPSYGAPSSVDDAYNGMKVAILTGTAAGEVAEITDYDGGTSTATIAFAAVPTTGDTYAIIPNTREILDELLVLKACEKACAITDRLAANDFRSRYAMERIEVMRKLGLRDAGTRFVRYIPRND